MTTTTQCLCAFLFFCGLSFAQENQELSPANYQYSFEIEFVSAQADEGTVKDIRAYSKDLFEVHPTFVQGTFRVATSFSVPEERVIQHLGVYGFNVTSIQVEKDGKILTTKNEEE
ncbi:hypothetical protein N9Y60_03705 [Crocinitomicaceae bacterium]|nr:hypothetical protein [Crocinitomicaceae bacterium]